MTAFHIPLVGNGIRLGKACAGQARTGWSEGSHPRPRQADPPTANEIAFQIGVLLAAHLVVVFAVALGLTVAGIG
jgi:hypothetical protein